MERLTTILTQIKSKFLPTNTEVVYETLRASSDSSEKLLPAAEKDNVVIESLRNDLRRARLRMRMWTAVLASLLGLVSLGWLVREMSAQSCPRRYQIHSELPLSYFPDTAYHHDLVCRG
jgi:hypothetical protein